MEGEDLHSNMVRFIIYEIDVYKTKHNIIYIPIWLDLLYINDEQAEYNFANLHSNMVRFIIQ